MARNIHPNLSPISVKCSGCGNSFELQTTINSDALDIENCFQCSPAYTGKRRSNTAGHGSDAFKKRFSGFDKLTGVTSSKK